MRKKTEAVTERCSAKQVFLKTSQNLQNCNFIKKETLAQVFSCEFCDISKNTFSYRTTPVATSEKQKEESRKVSEHVTVNQLIAMINY